VLELHETSSNNMSKYLTILKAYKYIYRPIPLKLIIIFYNQIPLIRTLKTRLTRIWSGIRKNTSWFVHIIRLGHITEMRWFSGIPITH